jgi:hypothetical protein
MKFTLAGFLAIAAFAFAVPATATQIPIPVAGFNQDVVVSATDTYPAGVTATMDSGVGATTGNTWYGVGFNALAPTTGLPIGPVTSESDPNTTLQLAPFGSGNVTSSNAVFLDAGNTTGALALSTPAVYSTLSLFGSTGNGTNIVNYTLNFADSSTQSGTLSFPDWFGNSPVAIDANGRVDQSGPEDVNSGNPNIYQENISFTPTGAALDSISLSYNSGPGNTAIFALSGTPVAVPEPASLVLFAIGAVGLLSIGHRRRAAWIA